MPHVTVLVPTHDHAATLPFAVASVLAQSVDDLDVVIVCDGVGDDTRDAVRDLERGDRRVRHVDHPKSPRHGEPARHAVLQECRSPFVAYHGDDDLLVPWHLEHLLEAIADRDFAHPLPLFFNDGDDEPVAFPMDLSDRRWVELQPIVSNHISLTGVVHTLDAYRRLPHGWRTAPAGHPTDDWMWRQWFTQPWFRGTTAPHATTVKLPQRSRRDWESGQRQDEIAGWSARMREPGFAEAWARIEDAAVRRAAVRAALESEQLGYELTQRMLRQWDVRIGEFRRRLRRRAERG